MEILPASLPEPCLHVGGQAEYGGAGVMESLTLFAAEDFPNTAGPA